jgi:single-strand DNA-binding protein
MNNITVAGQLGRDAEIRHMPNGDPVASFSVADSQGKDKPPIWWNASLFGKRAESLAPYLVKGQAVTITGTVTEREWTDKDGQKRKSMDVRVNDVALQGGKREGTTPVKTPDGQTAHMPRTTAAAGSGFDDMDDDIPF